MQPGDVTTTYADISKSQAHLGYKPQATLAEGMKQFTDWYLSYYLSP
jgi:UDP-glucuronate 4-epimerase